MTTEQTAQQLELAAQILRTGHPWERELSTGEWSKTDSSPITMISGGLKIRLALATPPDGRPLHNPDNLTAEQVGAGYRLMLPEEVDGRHEGKCQVWNGLGAWYSNEAEETHVRYSYRLPLTVPWPEPQPDPYAELKKAHAEGVALQYANANSGGAWSQWHDYDGSFPIDNNGGYRKWQKKPTFQLPPPPPGMQWHRTDGWEESDLQEGWRPHVRGECDQDGDEQKQGTWVETSFFSNIGSSDEHNHRRTRRSLTFTHAGKQWTWHRAGDPMPCDGERQVQIVMMDGFAGGACCGKDWDWAAEYTTSNHIIGWRYADEKKNVPLGPEDVIPGSVFRSKDQPGTVFWSVSQVWSDGFYLRGENVEWPLAKERMEINRSIPLTGKWNADAWEPCHKEIDA